MNFISPMFNPFNLPELPTIRLSSKNHYLRRPKRIPLKPIEDLDSILSILCINCQELINAGELEKHSEVCVSVSSSVAELDNMPLIIEAKFKLEKLQTCLESVLNKPSLSSTDKNYILVMIRYILSLQASNDSINIEKRIASIRDLLLSFKGSAAVKLYMDRFLSLACMIQQSICVDSPEKSPGLEVEASRSPDVLFEDLNGVKGQIEHYKNRAKVLEKIVLSTQNIKSPELIRRLDAIHSDIGSNKSFNQSASSVFSQEEAPRFSVIEEKLEMQSEDELKKYFYSLCLSQKIKFTSMKQNPPNLSIHKLYGDVTQQKIPPEAWFNYVVRQFEYPDKKYVQGLPRRNTSTKKIQCFEVIVEEDA